MNLGYAVLVLVIYTLVAARVTQFVNADSLIDPLRLAVLRRARDEGRSMKERERWATLHEFAACPWCISIWVGIFTAWIPVVIIGWPLWWCPLILLAVSHLVGVGARLTTGGGDKD
ncbi:uncharacterized protein RMCC_5777 [Mycolicibacterium canariasense]|uniref:DUF1360 domain-containing protein n=1 Tax=Mycolicibacterium canariasense TaxID=228230 RepID=A0A100WHP2_MYCCR|nr:DUF1360 domain-containing protein [Mycolicibacterium canariasense]MCV7210164.1 DUF1360 domain-containing protein [Mycolicibacterium canariasense]ORU97868.1 hypothetical protein AWB94_29390 [Mycolicibacterium canariasense]GAS98812.1 uncharacterized protein RMCC_5777 [Mycolicibacterium canariasense]